MQCRSSPEGPPSHCLGPTISVSPSAAGCGGQDIEDPYGISLRSAPRPVVWHNPPSNPRNRPHHPPHSKVMSLTSEAQHVNSTNESAAVVPPTRLSQALYNAEGALRREPTDRPDQNEPTTPQISGGGLLAAHFHRNRRAIRAQALLLRPLLLDSHEARPHRHTVPASRSASLPPFLCQPVKTADSPARASKASDQSAQAQVPGPVCSARKRSGGCDGPHVRPLQSHAYKAAIDRGGGVSRQFLTDSTSIPSPSHRHHTPIHNPYSCAQPYTHSFACSRVFRRGGGGAVGGTPPPQEP